jgi:hypothetical protein
MTYPSYILGIALHTLVVIFPGPTASDDERTIKSRLIGQDQQSTVRREFQKTPLSSADAPCRRVTRLLTGLLAPPEPNGWLRAKALGSG